MGANKNKKQATQTQVQSGRSPISPTNPIFRQSGNDERGRVQNTITDERARYRSQMDPYMGTLGEGFGNAMEQDQADYGDIMGRYRDVAGGRGNVGARTIGYSDPFTSYGGYEGFSKDGGYSPSDIANMRARGTSPIRAAYANAEREVGRQRSLQGGYSPNAIATQAKMAREQGQSAADATQNVEAGLAEARNKGRLAGLSGMSNIENSRLNAELDANKFNANAGMNIDMFNTGNQLDALSGMRSMYGTTPGRAQMFGDQLGRAIGQSGQQGDSYIRGETGAQGLDGRYENTKGYINDALTYANPIIDMIRKNNGSDSSGTSYGGGVQTDGTYKPGTDPYGSNSRIKTPPAPQIFRR